MKMLRSMVLCLAAYLLFGAATFAQTPDGVTPANEGVCDALQADGMTKGLYGLCVAFCEAQDHASLVEPISPDELESLYDTAPAGRIFESYNKKKEKANNPNDPDMPCVKVEEPCPCWTAEELASIDGILFDGVPASQVYCDLRDNDYGTHQTSFYRIYEDSYTSRPTRIYSIVTTNDSNYNGNIRGRCMWTNLRNNEEGKIFSRAVHLDNGDLTMEQYRSCQASISNRIEEIRSVCTHGTEAP